MKIREYAYLLGGAVCITAAAILAGVTRS